MLDWRASPSLVVVPIVFCVGTAWTTVILRWQDGIVIDGHHFHDPLVQMWLGALGRMMVLLVFIAHLWATKRSKGFLEPGVDYADASLNRNLFAIPATLQLTASVAHNVAVLWAPASIVQMMSSGTMFATAILGVAFLGIRPSRLEWVGMVAILAGVVMVGLAALQAPVRPGHASAEHPVAGVLIKAASVACSGIAVTFEKYLFSRVPGLGAIEAVAVQGTWGFVLSTVLSSCFVIFWAADDRPSDLPRFADQVGHSSMLLLTSGLFVVSVPVVTATGRHVIKSFSATMREVLKLLGTVLVWIVALLVFHERFLWLQLGGFLVIVCGTLAYVRGVSARNTGGVAAALAPAAGAVGPVDATTPQTDSPASPFIPIEDAAESDSDALCDSDRAQVTKAKAARPK